MSKRHVTVASLCLLLPGVLILIWATIPRSAPVSMRVLGYTAKDWPGDFVQPMKAREYVVATIELTNASRRPFVYRAWYHASNVNYAVLHRTATGWKNTTAGRFICGTGLEQFTLQASQTLTFDAVVDREQPCKVAFSYSDGRPPSRLWQRLPSWLAWRIYWGSGWSRVTTPVIDLRGATGLTVKVSQPLLTQPEGLHDVAAAAARGSTDAQFRLAGRYFTGSGVEKCLPEALRWYEAAATNGHAEAAYNLGTIYEYGLGPAADPVRAIEWYRRASNLGHERAQEKLRTLAAK